MIKCSDYKFIKCFTGKCYKDQVIDSNCKGNFCYNKFNKEF